jgi:hypothetical protein
MARITVDIASFSGNRFVRNQIASIRRISELHLEAVAKETVKVIREKITERITRTGSTGNLSNSFFELKITGGWGVGDIDFLNKQAPYWYWQNYGIAQSGRTTPPSSIGVFSDGSAPNQVGGTARWTQPGRFFINPKKPIEAKNYIQATIAELNNIVRTAIRGINI